MTDPLRDALAALPVLEDTDGGVWVRYADVDSLIVSYALRALAAQPSPSEPTICRCGLAKSYHGFPTNLADHEYEPRYPPSPSEGPLDVERLRQALIDSGQAETYAFSKRWAERIATAYAALGDSDA